MYFPFDAGTCKEILICQLQTADRNLIKRQSQRRQAFLQVLGYKYFFMNYSQKQHSWILDDCIGKSYQRNNLKDRDLG